MSGKTETADRVKELKEQLQVKVSANRELIDSVEVNESGTYEITAEHKAAFDQNTADIKSIQSLLDGFNATEVAEKWLAEPHGERHFEGEARQTVQAKSLGQRLIESPEFKELNGGRNGDVMRTAFEVNEANITSGGGQKDLYALGAPVPAEFPFGSVQTLPYVDRNRRTARVRDLFPVRTTTAAQIEFMRQSGFTNAAAPVAQRDGNEFALKPQSGMTWTSEVAPVRTIAHYEAAHRNILADEPRLRGLVDNELLYGLRLVEDQQLLAGSGTGEDIQGILNTPGIQSYSWSAGATLPVSDTKADAIRRAATLSFLAYYEPTGVVVHPNDWEDIELTKDANGQYLLAVSIALGGQPRVWNMPVIATPAIAEGTAVLGSFGLGAQVFDREQANIRVAEQHSDWFVRNAVAILAEERIALAVTRPESFVEILFDAPPS